jgi:hypothetical protein
MRLPWNIVRSAVAAAILATVLPAAVAADIGPLAFGSAPLVRP